MAGYMCENCSGMFETSEHLCGAALSKELKELTEVVLALKDQMIKECERLETKIDELETTISDATDGHDDLESRIEDLEDRFDKFERDIPDFDNIPSMESVQEVQDKVEHLSDNYDGLPERIDEVEARYGNLLNKLNKNFPIMFDGESDD